MFLIVCTSLVVIGLLIYRRSRKKPFSPIPGPKPPSAADGNGEELKACGSFHQFLAKNHELYGPLISYWVGPGMGVSIACEKLFQENSAFFEGPVEMFEFTVPLLCKNSVQRANGVNGRRRHSTYSKPFNASSLRRFDNIFNKIGKELVTKWFNWPERQYILLQDEMHEVALKSTLESMCGEEFEDKQLVADVLAIYEFCWYDMERFLLGDWPVPGSSWESEFEVKRQMVFHLIMRAVSSRRQLSDGREEKWPIDMVLELDVDELTITAELLMLFIGGFHTTAALLTWCIYYLATHQDIQDRVRNEVHVVVGESDEITNKMTNELIYLQQVLKETVRVTRMAPISGYIHHSDMELGGYKIPAKTPVRHAVGLSFYDEAIFPEPSRFDPDRFSAENEKLLPPFSFQPVGFGGKRKCPGYNFSMAEASTVLAHIIRTFRMELAYDQAVLPVFGFVTKIKENLWVTAMPASFVTNGDIEIFIPTPNGTLPI